MMHTQRQHEHAQEELQKAEQAYLQADLYVKDCWEAMQNGYIGVDQTAPREPDSDLFFGEDSQDILRETTKNNNILISRILKYNAALKALHVVTKELICAQNDAENTAEYSQSEWHRELGMEPQHC